jgi:hypothetical protein
VPDYFRAFPKDNVVSTRSLVTEEAAAVIRKWSFMDMQVYALADRLAKQKTAIAKKCLK